VLSVAQTEAPSGVLVAVAMTATTTTATTTAMRPKRDHPRPVAKRRLKRLGLSQGSTPRRYCDAGWLGIQLLPYIRSSFGAFSAFDGPLGKRDFVNTKSKRNYVYLDDRHKKQPRFPTIYI